MRASANGAGGFMRSRFLILLLVALLPVAYSSPALADPEGTEASGLTDPGLLALITDDDLFATTDLSVFFASSSATSAGSTKHYGPYPSTSPDSGTCGNAWATDTFDRHFTVKSNNDGTFTVVQQFKNGSFETIEGPSPGSCDPDESPPAGSVNGGVVGNMHGYFIIPIPFEQSSTDPSCVAGMPLAPCTTKGFVDSHFSGCNYPAPPCEVTTFAFHYSAGDQGLIQHSWKNASPDRGGNRGDIRSEDVPAP